MVLSLRKLAHSLKSPSHSDALSSSLSGFRSDIISSASIFKSGSEFMSLTGVNRCFELINITNMALEKLMMEIEYPIIQWGIKAIDEYLSYTSNLLDILNSITSSLSHINHARILITHSLNLNRIKNPEEMKKIPRKNVGKIFKLEGSDIRVQEKCCSGKELTVLEALIVSKKTVFYAVGLVLSGLCSDDKPFMEIRKAAGGFDDSVIKSSGLRLGREIKEVEEVNSAIEQLRVTISIKGVEELKKKTEMLEKLIHGTEKQTDHLFTEVLGTRNKLLDNLRKRL